MLLTLVASLGLYRSGSLAFLFVPAALVAIPVLALRLLERPVLVFAAFVVVAVNLDFIRFGDTAVTMDVLVSSLLLWALTVRLGLFEAFDFRNPVVRVMLLFLAATIISVVLSVNPVSSLKNWVRDIQYLVFFVFLITLPIRAADHRLLIGAIVASSVVPCLLGLLGVAFGLEVFYGQHTPLGGGELVQRIQSTLSHPVTFSHYLAMVSLLTLSLILAGDGWPRRYLVPVFMLQMVNLYGTYGRTGWGEFIIGFLVLLWITHRRKILLLGVPVLAAALLYAVPSFLARWSTITQGDDNSLLWRLGLWAYAITLVPQKPFFGSGQDTFIEYVAYDTGFAAHQTWMGVLVETGAVGLVAFAAVICVVGRQLVLARRAVGHREPAVAGLCALFAGFLVGSFVGDPWGLPSIAVYFWILTALVLHPSFQRRCGNSTS